MDIAILRWLVDAIKTNPNVKLEPSWIPHFSSLISERGIIEFLEDDIIFFLDHLQCLIDSNSLSMQQVSPLLDGFRNIFKFYGTESGVSVIQKVAKTLDKVGFNNIGIIETLIRALNNQSIFYSETANTSIRTT